MKRLATLSLLGLGLAGSAAAQTVTARVGGELTGMPGKIVLVPIAVDLSASGGEKLGSYTARLAWDPARLSACVAPDYYYYSCFDSIRAGNFPMPQLNYDSVAGTLSFTAISPAGAGGVVTIARIPFYLRDTLAAPLGLSFSEMSAAGTFTNLLPLLSVSGATMCPARGRWGDLDRDDRANSRDALLTLSKVVGLPVDTIVDTLQTNPLVVDTTIYDTGLADVNGDGNVQSVDALIILSYAVGIDIPGQRVLLLAPTSCGTGSARTVSVFPTAAELVPNQPLPLFLEARDSAGRTVTVSDAIWRSSDYNVAAVDGNGVVQPRAAGTATITGELGPGLRATTTITVIARRPNWFVSAAATGASVQLGNAAFPMDHPARAFGLVTEGDTIRVASGTYDFDNNGGQGDAARYIAGTGPGQPARGYGFNDDVPIMTGLVILGGTPGDTTTRPVFRATNYYGVRGLLLSGGNRVVVKNVVLRDFDPAFELDGTRTVAIEDSRIEIVNPNNFGDGVYSCSSTPMDTLRIDRSAFVGDSSGDAVYFGGCSSGGPDARVLLVRDSKMLRWSDAIYTYEVDSAAIIRSEIAFNDGYGISMRQENVVNPSLYIAHSRIDRNYYEAVSVDNARRVVVDTSFIRADEDDALVTWGGCGECSGDTETQVYLHGDTIHMAADDYSWLDTYLADTTVVQDVVVQFADSANFYAYGSIYGRYGRVTNSQFLNAGAGTVLQFSGSYFLADSVTMTGCTSSGPGCDRASGLYLQSNSGVLDAFVRRSSFTQIEYPIYAGGGGQGIHEVAEVTVDSAAVGIDVGGDSAIVRDNVVSRAYGAGIRVQGFPTTRGPSLVDNNTIGCGIPGGEASNAALVLNTSLNVLVRGTTIADPSCMYGITVYRLGASSVLKGNTLRGLQQTAISAETYDSTLIAIDSNVISGEGTGNGTGIGIYNSRVRLTRNSIGNGLFWGMFVSFTPGYVQIASDSNVFTGFGAGAISSSTDSVDATNNWWGSAAGPQGTDSVVGPRIAVSPFLTTPPIGVPAFVPRAFMPLAGARATTFDAQRAAADRVTRITRRPADPAARVLPAAKPARVQHALPAGIAPERAARIQRDAAKRAARESARAARVSGQGARRGPS